MVYKDTSPKAQTQSYTGKIDPYPICCIKAECIKLGAGMDMDICWGR